MSETAEQLIDLISVLVQDLVDELKKSYVHVDVAVLMTAHDTVSSVSESRVIR